MATRYLILGDTHGDFFWTLKVLDHAKDLKIHTIFQVGDWGFLWPDENGRTGDQIDALAQALRARDQRMCFIDGNHDWHPELRNRKLPRELVYCYRGTDLVFATEDLRSVRVGFLGGAPSIDRANRTEGVDWWPQEEIEDHHLSPYRLDVLIAHDAPELPPNLPDFPADQATLYRCKLGRAQIQRAIRQSQPRILFHGHYHTAYQGSFEGTEVRGLNCNRETGAYVIVNHNFEEITEGITGWVTK